MRGIVAAVLVAALLGMPIALAAGVSAADGTASRDLTPQVIGPVPTDRFGGGDLIAVRAGDANFGVRYGTADHPNDVVLFAEYKRFLGAADIVDESGRLLATRGIPVYTVVGQSLTRFIEFEHRNETAGFDLNAGEDSLVAPINVPIKALRLTTSWELSDLTYEVAGPTTYVNFTVTARDLPYTWVNPFVPQGDLGDHLLNAVAFTFRLRVDIVDRGGEIPWYRVTVTDSAPREIKDVEFVEWRNVSGQAVDMGAKYDQAITGWDFANGTNDLALETHLIFGNYVPDRTVDFIHEAYFRDHADDGTTPIGDETQAGPDHPTLYTRDRIYLNDNWTRIGRFEWVSNVTVDGHERSMLFEIQNGGRLYLTHSGAVFLGFWLRAAFVYPAGERIVHDPAMKAEAFLPSLTTGFVVTPLGLLLVQAAVVGVAIIPALYLRSKARRQA